MIPASFAPWINHLWQSTLFAAVAGLLTLALQRNKARVRYWLWLAASCKFLIPFSLLISLGSLLRWRVAPAPMPHAFSAVADTVLTPIFVTPLPTVNSVPSHTPAFVFVVWAVWACGFVAVVAGGTREWLRIRAIVRAASPLPLELPIQVKRTPAQIEPGVFGIFRPVLLLPEGIESRLTQAQLQGILEHELYHFRRRDNFTAALHMLVEAIFWFHPLVWWMGQQLMAEREQACDEEVLESGRERQLYAESILKVCEFCAESPLACVSGVMGADLKKRLVRIITKGVARKLNLSRKLLLSTAGIAAVVAPIIFGHVSAKQAHAQSQAQNTATAAPTFEYEVATIKPSKPGEVGSFMTIPGPGPVIDTFTARNLTLMTFIQEAYGIAGDDGRISGEPKWAKSEKYDIDAKMDISVVDGMKKLALDQRTLESQRMLQALLADRFKLKVHREAKELSVYSLVIAKNGAKLQEAKPDEMVPNGRKGPGIGMRGSGGPVVAQAVPISFLAEVLTTIVGRTVLDKTGLTGKYDFTLRWTPDEGQGPSFLKGPGNEPNNQPPPPELNTNGPSLFTALQEQLGLKLESQKGPVEVIVIDHVERPSAN